MMKNASAPEADGWRVSETQALPLQLFDKIGTSAEFGSRSHQDSYRQFPKAKDPHLKKWGR